MLYPKTGVTGGFVSFIFSFLKGQLHYTFQLTIIHTCQWRQENTGLCENRSMLTFKLDELFHKASYMRRNVK